MFRLTGGRLRKAVFGSCSQGKRGWASRGVFVNEAAGWRSCRGKKRWRTGRGQLGHPPVTGPRALARWPQGCLGRKLEHGRGEGVRLGMFSVAVFQSGVSGAAPAAPNGALGLGLQVYFQVDPGGIPASRPRASGTWRGSPVMRRGTAGNTVQGRPGTDRAGGEQSLANWTTGTGAVGH